MFSKATVNFVRQIDPEGSLIHVSRINDSKRLVPMALVVKQNRVWFWQRPKYQPTDFTLSDLLQGNKVLRPGVSATEFLTYKGIYGDKVCGKLDTKAASKAGSASLTIKGCGTSELQSRFGQLKKEELDVKKLLHDCSHRHVDMKHVLVQQLKKKAELLAVVKERILTTTSCSITQMKKDQCAFKGMIGLGGILGSSAKVCVKETNNFEADSDVSLDIPSGTVIAYSILELEVKKDGLFDLCLQPGTTGGIESDSAFRSWPSEDSLHTVDGRLQGQVTSEEEPLTALLNGSLEMDLSPLTDLTQSAQWALFKGLQDILRDRSSLTLLQCVLEDLCGVTAETARFDELSENPVSDLLKRLGAERPAEGGPPAHLKAAHLLVSALDELPEETLRLLSDSRPGFLLDFNSLMFGFKENSKDLSNRAPPLLLQDNQDFQLAEQLLGSTGAALKRDAARLWVEAGSEAGLPLVVLYLSTHGLALLCGGLK